MAAATGATPAVAAVPSAGPSVATTVPPAGPSAAAAAPVLGATAPQVAGPSQPTGKLVYCPLCAFHQGQLVLKTDHRGSFCPAKQLGYTPQQLAVDVKAAGFRPGKDGEKEFKGRGVNIDPRPMGAGS